VVVGAVVVATATTTVIIHAVVVVLAVVVVMVMMVVACRVIGAVRGGGDSRPSEAQRHRGNRGGHQPHRPGQHVLSFDRVGRWSIT